MTELENGYNPNEELFKLLIEIWPLITEEVSSHVKFFTSNETGKNVDKRSLMIKSFRKALDHNLLEKYKIGMMEEGQSKEYDVMAEKLYDLAVEENRLPEDLCFKK